MDAVGHKVKNGQPFFNNHMVIKPQRRRPLRLSDYDYARNGAYFITIVIQGRKCLFGEVVNGEMELNEAGKMVEQVWLEIPDHFPNVTCDTFIIMPNHIHGIIVIEWNDRPIIVRATHPRTELGLCVAPTTASQWTIATFGRCNYWFM
jgi:REP element-mobilizing transposase RayT